MNRYRVAEVFLKSGTPLERVHFFRPLLERADVAITEGNHLKRYVPLIEQAEFARTKAELEREHVSVFFDGTTRLGEAVNIVVRWVTADFSIKYRLIRFVTTRLHMKASELASLITRVLFTEYSLTPERVVSFTRDSVSVNGAACRLLRTNPFTSTISLLCISHTLNNTGKSLAFRVLPDFTTPWLELVGGRGAHAGAKRLWVAAVAPQSVPGFSNTRWYAKAEIQFVLAENFSKIGPFLDELDAREYGDATRSKMRAIWDDKAKREDLELELAGACTLPRDRTAIPPRTCNAVALVVPLQIP